jgi:hypothetical protein
LWPSGKSKVFLSLSVRVLACTLVIPAVFYLLTRLAGCLVGPGISYDTRKLDWTPRLKKKKKKKAKCKSHMVSLRSVKKYTWIPLNLCWISIVLSSTIGPIMEIIGKWQKKRAFLTCIYLNCPSYKAAKNVFAPK